MAMEMPVSDLPLGVFCNEQHHQMAIQWLHLEICCKAHTWTTVHTSISLLCQLRKL